MLAGSSKAIRDRTEPEDQLARLIEPYLARGQFTHLFAECGSLVSESAPVSYEVLPQGQEIFDLASITKALVTTPLIFRESIATNISLFAPVGEWLKGTDHGLCRTLLDLSVESLLRHESGLPAWRNFWIHRLGKDRTDQSTRHAHIATVLNRSISDMITPGQFIYSDLGFILLGMILELRHGQIISEIFRSFMTADLALEGLERELGFAGEAIDPAKTIPTSFCMIRERQLHGEVHDENCASLLGATGHAGLFGSGNALIKYLKRLSQSAVGKILIKENGSRIVPGGDPLLGWRQRSRIPLPFFVMGHLGFTGTAFWTDEAATHYLVLLTNRVISGRKSPWIAGFREDCYNILSTGIER